MRIAERMHFVPFSEIRVVFEEVSRREQAGQKIYHLEIGRPDFDTPVNIKEAAKRALDAGLVHYTSNYGLMELRQAIARRFKQYNGLDYNPENEIVVTAGGTEAMLIATMALLDPGDEVLIPTPIFQHCIYNTRMAGAVPVLVPLDENNGFIPDMDLLRAHITPRTKMLVITTPSNPTGTILHRNSLEGLAQLAQEYNLYVIADEIYDKMIYDEQVHVSMAGLPGMRDRTLTLNGFSKTYSMTGWRLGYVAAHANLISAMIRIHQYSVSCATSFAQWGAVEALNGPQDSVAAMVGEFDRRRQMVYQRLTAMPGLKVTRPQGAFYIYINITGLGQSSAQIARLLLEKAQVAVVPWTEVHIRVAYTTSYDNLAAAMDRMETVLGGLK
ncbi:MAG: pyridoxal phosphate-dependent aminotransferase [Deltaproteobacteria bacterium]|nr:pyridoxal phosphate-dependent aminotransferase [Deltaproteobacteria bacterium]